MGSIRVLVTMPDGEMYRQIFVPSVMEELAGFSEVCYNRLGRDFRTEELAEAAVGMDALLTSWGVPRITKDVLEAASGLKMIAHAAGSVKHLVAQEVFDAGVAVTNAARVMAPSVAEHALGLTLALLRNTPQHAEAMKEGYAFGSPVFTSNEGLFEQRVGLIGFGHTGREFARLLLPFRVKLLVCDPYCPQDRADEYGAKLVTLDELMSTCKVVSIHASVTDETRGMLNAEKLRLMRDGSVLVNTARGVLIDHDALLRELRTGRIKAAMDVTAPEPLPLDHELRTMQNVILTPHIAGPTWDRRWTMAKAAVEDLKRFFEGRVPANMVTRDMLATMA